jgi:hypothetical protein
MSNIQQRQIMKPCKDCLAYGVTTKRPAPFSGPRCATHNRAAKRRRRDRAHELRVEKTYGLTAQEYQALYEAQDGRCFVCHKARGIKKRLAVDHDHDAGCDHGPDVGCRECVRCLACVNCNRIILGRYSVEALQRAIEVLTDPPARRILELQ